MTNPVSEILNSYLNPQSSLEGAVRRDQGLAPRNVVEQDVGSLTPYELVQKYGNPTSESLIAQRRLGDNTLYDLQAQRDGRTDLGAYYDTLTGVGTGFGNSIAGIGALGLGVVNQDAGVWAANKIKQGNDWVQQNLQTPGLNAARQLNSVQNNMDEAENKRLYNQDKADGLVTAGLRRVGRDAVDSVSNALADPVIAAQGTSEAVGSLLGGGPIAKGLKAVGKTALARLGAGAAIVESAAMPAAIGLMEGGGAYQQTVSDIMGMTHEQLVNGSDEYRALISEGMSEQDAKQSIANRAGLLAAGIQAPVAAATGTLVSAFESNPFARRTISSAIGNLVKEPIEEGIQSGAGQLAQNIATAEYADKNKDMLSGVGEQAGLGALYGFTAAGTVQAPSLSAETAKASMQVIGKAASAAVGSVLDRGNRVLQENDKASPVSDDTILAGANAAVETAPQNIQTIRAAVENTDATPEQKQEAESYLAGLESQLNLSPEERADSFPATAEIMQTATNRVDLVQKLANLFNTAQDEDTKFAASLTLYSQMMTMHDFSVRESEAISKASEDSNVANLLRGYENLRADILQNETLMQSLAAAKKVITEYADSAEITDQNIETPEGAQQASAVVAAAEVDPGSVPLAKSEAVLYQNSRGKFKLTEPQRAALLMNKVILEATEKSNALAESYGLRKQDRVSAQITTDDIRDGTKSAKKHASDVITAMRAGNTALAKELLNDFGLFVDHMHNKVNALNQHFRAGDPSAPGVTYEALMPDRTWRESKNGMFVNTNSVKSLELNQSVNVESQVVTDVFNGLTQAFPELAIKPKAEVKLDSALDGKISEVADRFKINKQAKTDATNKQPTGSSDVAESKQDTQQGRVERTEDVSDGQDKPAPETRADRSDEPVAPSDNGTTDTDTTLSTEKVSAMDSLYPNLLSSDTTPNGFKRAFRVPQEPRTTIIGDDAPIDTLMKEFKSESTFNSFLGSKNKGRITVEALKAFRTVIQYGKTNMKPALQKQLDEYLNAPYSKSVKASRREVIEQNIEITTKSGTTFKGSDLLNRPEGMALNIVEKDADGNFKYNDALIETAILAATDWLINAQQVYGRTPDAREIADMVGVQTVAEIGDDSIVERLSQGLSTETAKSTLAANIQKFWGMSVNKNTSMSLTKGISEGVASEILRALADDGSIVLDAVKLTEDNGLESPKTFNRWNIVPFTGSSNEAVNQYPDAINKSVMIDPEPRYYFGDDIPEVSDTQLNNGVVKNTKEQKQALRKAVETPYYLHTPMLNFYVSAGLDNILKLHGINQDGGQVMNVNHAKSVQGKITNITSSYKALLNTVMQMDSAATAANVDVTELPVRYNMNMSTVGRMQMLGGFNPQSSKLMREALLPTFATLDLSDRSKPHYGNFMVAIGQHLGIKVHNMSREAVIQKVEERMNGPLKPALEIALKLSKTDAMLEGNDIEVFQKSIADSGSDSTPGAWNALVEYARYQEATDKSAFRTPLYLEADGMTNGPINAMGLMSVGAFDEAFLDNMEKGGVAFGRSVTANELRQANGTDLYQETANRFAATLNRALAATPAKSKDGMALRAVLNLLNMFDKNLSFDESADSVQVNRNITKNPLTITIYGSGAAGIANNIAGALVDAIYVRMTQAAQAQADSGVSVAEALFGQGPQAANQFDMFRSSLQFLTGYKGPIDPLNFTLDAGSFKRLQRAMNEYYVPNMRGAITSVVGESLMSTVEVIRQAAQIQSILASAYFRKKFDELVSKNEKKQLPSEKEMDELYADLFKRFPMVQTGEQNFFIAGSSKADLPESQFGAALNGQLRTDAYIYGPSNAGVAAIPFLTIGMGDGMMMQLLAKQGLQGVLMVFDGMNMPLDQINSYSRRANEAVYNSWKGNPAREVSKVYSSVMEYLASEGVPEGYELELTKAIYGPQADTAESAEVIIANAGVIGDSLAMSANSIDARHKAMQSVLMSVDQMAAAGSNFVNSDAAPSSRAEVLEQLNKAYTENFKAPEAAEAPTVEKANPIFEKIGRGHSTGVRILSQTSLAQIATKGGLSESQKTMLKEIIKAGAVKDFTIVVGTPEQVTAYQQATGKSAAAGDSNGYIVFDDRTLYVTNATGEVLVHELIHAATFENVLSYYENNASGDVARAIERIERQMEQFMQETSGVTSGDVLNVRSSILSVEFNTNISEPVRKAQMLNEFMAWTLSNRGLEARAANTRTIYQIATDAVKRIKELVWTLFGRRAPKVADDVLSNLQFNTKIIINAPKVQTQMSDVVAYHSDYYGNKSRIEELGKTFERAVGSFVSNSVDPNVVAPVASLKKSGRNQADLAVIAMNNGFPMTAQEQSVFGSLINGFQTEINLDSNSMAKAQQIYTQVLKQLKLEDFNPTGSNNPNDMALAQDRFNVITGNFNLPMDSKGRSSLVPMFLALAMVSDDFRAVLAKIEMPKKEKGDSYLTNLGNGLLDSLSNKLTGLSGTEKNVRDALDSLMQNIHQTIEKSDSNLETQLGKLGGLTDRGNQKVVELLDAASKKTVEASRKMQQSSSKAVAGAGKAVEILGKLLTEEGGENVAVGSIRQANLMKIPQAFSDLLFNLVGRTYDNAAIYDMIKQARAFIQQTRQHYRNDVPTIISSKFSRTLSNTEWSQMHRSIGKTDITSLLGSMSDTEIGNLFADQKNLSKAIKDAESALSGESNQRMFIAKSKQLAKYMVNGTVGSNLLSNAYAIAHLYGEVGQHSRVAPTEALINNIDKLVTLYAIDELSSADKASMKALFADEAEGMKFVMSYLKGVIAYEKSGNVSEMAKINGFKGYVPQMVRPGMQLVVAPASEHSEMLKRSFTMAAYYQGSNAESGRGTHAYYFAPVTGRAAFNQGIFQNVRHTHMGVDHNTGYSMDSFNAGRITDRTAIKNIRTQKDNGSKENLRPVYNEAGNVVAYERTFDPAMVAKVLDDSGLHTMLGVWAGRQVEEAMSAKLNNRLIDNLKQQYEKDKAEGLLAQYENVMTTSDPVTRDAVNLLSKATKDYITSVFGEDNLPVRRDLIYSVTGYRSATVGDMWSGNTRWSKKTQDAVQNLAISVFGNKAYQYMINAEQMLQGFVQDAKDLIIVKSVVVPVSNMISNIYQMIARGIPLASIVKGIPTKLSEIHSYSQSLTRLVQAEAELLAAEGNVVAQRKLQNEIQTIRDSHKRMSIWPLIEAGEFTALSDHSMTEDTVELTSGRLYSFLDQQVMKLPKSIRNAGRYAVITKDTSFYKGMQLAVQYGDFIAKAVTYDDMTKRQKMSQSDALGRITEEFVNYDVLPGRDRGYLESIGLMWFWNFKIRSAKVALSMLRNNPLHSLIAMAAPTPDLFGSVGTPIEDNVFSKLGDGSLDYSLGIGQAIRAPMLHPWVALAN